MIKFIFFIAMIILCDQALSSTVASEYSPSSTGAKTVKRTKNKQQSKKHTVRSKNKKLGLNKKRKKIGKVVQKGFRLAVQKTLNNSDNQEKTNGIKNSIYLDFIKTYYDNPEGFFTVSNTITTELLKNVKSQNQNKDIGAIIEAFIIEQIIKNIEEIFKAKKDIQEFDIIAEKNKGIVATIVKKIANLANNSAQIPAKESKIVSETKPEEILLIDQTQINDIKDKIKERFLANAGRNIIALAPNKDNLSVDSPTGDIIDDGKKIIVSVAQIEKFLTTGVPLKIQGKEITNSAWIDQENKLIFESILNEEAKKAISDWGVVGSTLLVGTLFSNFHTSLWEILACFKNFSHKKFSIKNNYYQYNNKNTGLVCDIVHKKFIEEKSKNEYSLFSTFSKYLEILKELIANRSSTDALKTFSEKINNLVKNKNKENRTEENDPGWLITYITMISLTIAYIQENESMTNIPFKKDILKNINNAFQEELQGQVSYIYRLISQNIFYKNIFDTITFEQIVKNHYMYNQDITKIMDMRANEKTRLRYEFDFRNDKMAVIFYLGIFALVMKNYVEVTDAEAIFELEKNIDYYFEKYFNLYFARSELAKKKKELLEKIDAYNNKMKALMQELLDNINFNFKEEKEQSQKRVKIIHTIKKQLINKDEYKKMIERNAQYSVQGAFPVDRWAMSKKFLIWVNDKYQTPIEGLTVFSESDFNSGFNLMLFPFNELTNKIDKEITIRQESDSKTNNDGGMINTIFEFLTNQDNVNEDEILTYLFQLMFNTNVAIEVYEELKNKNSLQDEFSQKLLESISKDFIPVIKKLCYYYAKYVELLYISPEAGDRIEVTKILAVTGGLLGAYIGIGSAATGGFGSLVGVTVAGGAAVGKGALALAASNPISAGAVLAAMALYKYRGVIANQWRKAKPGFTKALKNLFS